ncbi:hypothetical protein SESBI_12601 [Sesbania bispinosa]|nr:hypothetical protein SESBI_12601 [Sesbania bispinosa]
MSSSSPTQDLSSDPSSESGNTSSCSFSSLLGDNPLLNTNQVPIVNIPDSEETESDSEDLSDGGRNIPPPKIYKTFLTETYNNNSEYASLSAIERFRKSTPVANLTDGNPHFPLFWSLEPRRVPVVKFDQLSFDEKIDVAFLRNQAPIDCGFLLENEDLPARLRQSLDKMPPKTLVPQVITNEKALRRWLKKVGVDPNAPNSEIQATAPGNERRKKQKLDTSRGNQQQQTETVGDAMGTNLDIPPAKTTEGSDITSIFDYRFPVEQVVGCEFNKKEDIARVNKVGVRNVGKHLMTMGMQTSFFGYCFDSALNSVEKEMKDRALKIQELTVKLQAAESATQTIASLEKSLLEANTKLTTTEAEKTTAKTRCSEFETKYSDVVAEQVKLKKDFDDVVAEKLKLSQDLSDTSEQNKQLTDSLDALQKEVAILHAQGFRKAIDQVKLLNPGVNVEGLGVFKKIVDGKLVEESKDDEE